MVGNRSDSPAYTASIRAYSCRGTSVQLAWELSQGQVVPYLSSHVPVTVPRRDPCILGQNSCRRTLRAPHLAPPDRRALSITAYHRWQQQVPLNARQNDCGKKQATSNRVLQ